jgi:hypothetical protein
MKKRSRRTNHSVLQSRKLREPYDSAVLKAMETDRNWFAQHPGHDQYIRDYIAGEFEGSVPPRGYRVLVTQIHKTCRYRAMLSAAECERVESGVRFSTGLENLLKDFPFPE